MIRQTISFNPSDFIGIKYATSFKIQWLIKDKSHVSIGTPIVMLTLGGGKRQSVVIKSEFEGMCHFFDIDEYPDSFPTEVLGYVVDDEMDFIYPYELDNHKDTFTHEISIEWKQIAGFKTTVGVPLSIKNIDSLYISNYFKEGKLFLVFNFATMYIKLKKGDTISLKFNNGEILDFTLISRPSKNINNVILPENNEHYLSSIYVDDIFEQISHYAPVNIGKKKASIRRNAFCLSRKDIFLFLSETLSAFRLTFNSEGGSYIDGKIENKIMTENECPKIIKNMFIKMVGQISAFDPSYSMDKLKDNELVSICDNVTHDSCYVYLMHDEANNFYKIGMSNNPVYREGTLQSEKPTIKLIVSHKYPTRKFAAAIETALHNMYSDVHVRGEWYRLNKDDVNVIVEGLK